VSRIIMLAIIDLKNRHFAGFSEKRLTGRFALPNKDNRYLDLLICIDFFVYARRNRIFGGI
jgi:hypothetical protein